MAFVGNIPRPAVIARPQITQYGRGVKMERLRQPGRPDSTTLRSLT